jgi:hypothetical protein
VPKQKRKIKFGLPITNDSRTTKLDDAHRSVLDTFIEKARSHVTRIMDLKGFKQRPISDGKLREIGIAFPRDEDEFMQISDMSPEMYKVCGAPLLRLIKDAQRNYRAMKLALGQTADEYGFHDNYEDEDYQNEDDDQDEDEDVDPNHKTVVEISDDDADEIPTSQSDVDMDEAESSHYFGVDDEVDRFNEQSKWFHHGGKQAYTDNVAVGKVLTFTSKGRKETSKRSSSQSRGGSTYNRGSRGSKRGRNSRGSGSKPRAKATTDGVSQKKKSSSNSRPSGNRTDLSGYVYKQGGTSGGRGGGGIGMMPT